MKISDIKDIKLNVLKDGIFENLGSCKNNYPKMLTYVENDEFLAIAKNNPLISCIITKNDFADKFDNCGVVVSDNPKETFYSIHEFLGNNTDFYRKNIKKSIDLSAKIDKTAHIAENVIIGKNVLIEKNVVILDNTIIGNDVIIRSGAVIGTQGFSFYRKQNTIKDIFHAGGVTIGNRVEIQANSCISRSIFNDFTEIGDMTKIDNLVHIAHGVKIGKRCLLAANCMIAGYTKIGDDSWIGPSSSISSELELGKNVFITIGSVITKNVLDGSKMSGNFAIEHDKFIEFIKKIR
ncbi:MAG TPA: UDP-3-O-(3-hydroxymyristoyl)glucosamine N-acyltransferase [Candidatus Pacearchaeota archaeon]|nr:UDP-3-O-(3-hydroxymyristoyl)glucosamine N-acyltransferase [Candidatus Pacearchaeota archaeon]